MFLVVLALSTALAGEVPMSDFHDAVAAGDLTTVRVLLAEGADVGSANEYGIPALHTAARNGHVDVMQALVDAGADLEATTRDGRTAFAFATDLCKDPAPTRWLLERGATVADPERSIRNAWSSETKQLLSEHFGLPIPPPRKRRVPDPPTAGEWAQVLPKIEAVFASLSAQRMLCLVDAGFTQGMAHAALATEIAGGADASGGWCFTTSQDMDRARRRGFLPIGFGSQAGSDEAVVAVGQAIVDAFTAAGFEVEWAGSSSMRPSVKVRSGL
jgi:hypothetical protein